MLDFLIALPIETTRASNTRERIGSETSLVKVAGEILSAEHSMDSGIVCVVFILAASWAVFDPLSSTKILMGPD